MLDVKTAVARFKQAGMAKQAEFRHEVRPIGDAEQVRAVLASQLSGAHLEAVTRRLIQYRVAPEVFLAATNDGTAGAHFTVRQLATLEHVGLPPVASWQALNAFPRFPDLNSRFGIARLIECAGRGDSAEAIHQCLTAACASVVAPANYTAIAAIQGSLAAACISNVVLPAMPDVATETSVAAWLTETQQVLRRTADRLAQSQVGSTKLRDELLVFLGSLARLERRLLNGDVSPAGALKIAQRAS